MRLWTLHPRYLDAKGLVALWREALLAKAVLKGETRGYKHHPQLERFRATTAPLFAINTYLSAIHDEALARGYAFDRGKIGPVRRGLKIATTKGQVAYERKHLMRKLSQRDPALGRLLRAVILPDCHPLFLVRAGAVEPWERGTVND